MTDTFTPPKVWTWDAENGGEWAKLNRPIAGATHDKDLPIGEHPLQLYSLATPNGVKVTVMLEELLAAGHGAEYDAWLINIMEGDQFGSGFVDINPNSKIPALRDHDTGQRVFESGAILMYLAEKFGAFLPASGPARTETLNWLFWLQGAAPVPWWRLWALLRLCTRKIRIPDQPLRNGSQSASLAFWTFTSPTTNTLQAMTTRSPTLQPRLGTVASSRVTPITLANSCLCTNTPTSSAGIMTSAAAPPISAVQWSTKQSARLKDNYANGTTRRISTHRPRTNCKANRPFSYRRLRL